MKSAKAKFYRVVAIYLVINFFSVWVFPVAVYALTAGPGQPEFASFEPVATTNMVNEFTGGFTYNLPVINVPGPNGSGYAASLSYHSGATMEEEASWVGYGWTLNPGAINRGKQGLPDDYKKTNIDYTNQIPSNWSVGAGPKFGAEIYSIDFSISQAMSYNNNKGFGNSITAGLSAYKGLASLNYTVSEEGHSFSAEINPGAYVAARLKRKASKAQDLYKRAKGDEKTQQKLASKIHRLKNRAKVASHATLGNMGSEYGLFSLFGTEDSRALTVGGYLGRSVDVTFTIGVDPSPLHIGFEVGGIGSFSKQDAISTYSRNAYGYMYSNQWNADPVLDKKLADYRVEKESSFNKRDMFLPIPYNNPDNFNISGEGIGGSFRMYNKSTGHVKPTQVHSYTAIVNAGLDITLGLNLEGFGFNTGIGAHNLNMNDWNNIGNTDQYVFANTGDEGNFFRFAGDLGGNVIYAPDDVPYQADISNINNTRGVKQFQPIINTSSITGLSERPGRSSYIGYHTNAEMAQTVTNTLSKSIAFKSYLKNDPNVTTDVYDMVANRTADIIKDRIGEIATVNEDGNTYVYGLPVFAGNEKNMTIGIKEPKTNLPAIQNKFLVYKNENASCQTKIGETRNDPYANSFLLTQITNPDYIDRTFDGPTYDDLGGWTKFNYGRSKNGASLQQPDKSNTSNWYQWRFPYTGLFYDKHELCDSRDDMGSYTTGLKEIYFLQTIETKTHIAYFITDQTSITFTNSDNLLVTLKGSNVGTGNSRKDGLGASSDASNSSTAQNVSQTLEKLERVILYAKDANNKITGKALKTVHLEYNDDGTSYSTSKVLCKNLPNGAATYSNGKNAGKLTLNKVWFEYEGISNSKISPYVFKYEYKLAADYVSTDLKTKYTSATDPNHDVINYGANLTSAMQNPDYDIFGFDSWGNYCLNGAARLAKMKHWVYQGIPDPTFDPAVWQLKVIKLPSGGEILIQYEQNDYSNVQDQPALAMVSLRDQGGNIGTRNDVNSDNKYYLGLSDIEMPDLNGDHVIDIYEYNQLALTINNYLNGADKHKIYFKFLYALMGGTPDIEGCGVEYISGYMDASATGDASGVYISFSGNGTYKFPRNACKDFVKRTKSGLRLQQSCDNDVSAWDLGDPVDMVKRMLQKAAGDVTGGADYCLTMSLENSYVRIPMLTAKKGGGIRVKRVLMHDAGLEPGLNGDESIYGTEYIYKNVDGTSSGVAANEPAGAREENALINFIKKRSPQSLLNKVICGKDKENFEGPIGEELLPGPSIGYARVISQNIHSGKSGTGFRVSEYITTKQFPLSKGTDHTDMDDHAFDKLPIPAIWVNLMTDNKWLSQGYSFILNNMNGQLQRIATYGGIYVAGQSEDTYYKSYEEVHEYFNPGEKVPVMNEDGTITTQYVGKESEVSMEMRSVTDVHLSSSFQMDIDLGMFLAVPVPQFSFFPYVNFTERKLRTHVINKVANYAAILKKTTTTKDGIVQISENRVFSKSTGLPIVTTTRDGYDKLTMEQSPTGQTGTYTNYTIPANYVYKQMGQMSRNERFTYSPTSAITLNDQGSGVFSFDLPVADASLITGGSLIDGDLIRLGNGTDKLFYISSFSGNTVYLKVVSWMNNSLTNFNSLEVLNSGYTNDLGKSAGSIVTYGTSYPDPLNVYTIPPSALTISSGVIQQAALNKVLSASAETYSDQWNGVNFLGNQIIDPDYNITYSNNNDFELGKRGKWRVQSNYTCKSDIKDAFTANNRVYTDAGIYTGYAGFNYTSPVSNNANQWLKTNTVNFYSPHGNALEEQNILGVKSTAKFGYRESVPVLIAHNAPYTSVLFSGFEDVSGAVNTTAHSGNYSYPMALNAQYSPGTISIDMMDALGNFDNTINKNGVSLKFWTKTPDVYSDDVATYLQCTLKDINSIAYDGKLKKVARVGEWTLMEAKFSNMNYPSYSALTVNLKNTGNFTLWIDDVRVQPSDAQMACYVYDKNNLRLLTSFDDQHFGLYYQYNAEGKLLRKLVETERGIKTVQETQYNVPVE